MLQGIWAETAAQGAGTRMQDEIEQRVSSSGRRALFDLLPQGMVASMLAALGVFLVLQHRLALPGLTLWLVARMVISLARLAHGVAVRTGRLPVDPWSMRVHTALAALDGCIWGLLGWGLSPITNLEVCIVTIPVLIAISCVGAMVMSVNLRSAISYVAPITVPNAIYAVTRQDDLGYFCMAAVLGLTVLLILSARGANRRLNELTRLRFESELSNSAKTEALRQAKLLAEARSRFVATMSHEMRTPLHGMLGLVRLMKDDVVDPAHQQSLGLIQGSGEHLLSVINDVLDFSKTEAGGLAIRDQDFNLQRLLKDVTDMVRVSCVEKGLALEVNIRLETGDHVRGDPVRVKQILLNLLGNAIKFTPRGVIALHVWRDPLRGTMQLAVRDTGIGIPAQELARVFEPFHQAQGTYERNFGGTGLGLTISRDLCERMGGSLRCESEPGVGSVFTCELPMPAVDMGDRKFDFDSSPTLPMDLDEPRREPSVEGLRVLLVEDNPVNALVAQAMLDRLGARTIHKDNGLDAIEWLENHPVDLVFMDCEMPRIDGVETTRRIRHAERHEGRKRVPIVALTASGLDAYDERCAPVGMDDYLAKPFTPADLSRVLTSPRLGLPDSRQAVA